MLHSFGRFYTLLVVVLAGWLVSASALAVELSGIAKVSAGVRHTCALTTQGGVKCWGDHYNGQLGTGNGWPKAANGTPVNVSGLSTGVADVSAADNHTCALTTSGGVKCWGYGYIDSGDFPVNYILRPTDVPGLTSGVAAITANGFHACALTTAGGVKCWGNNAYGQLGDNSIMSRMTPADVSGLTSGVIAISAGEYYTCALTTVGGVKCWGANNFGQLGDNSTAQRLVPVDVVGLSSGVIAIASGESHTCALTTSAGVKCWGGNASGEVGDGSSIRRLTPVDVTGLASGVTSIRAGNVHTCAMTELGEVKCWGSNAFGQLGDGTIDDRLTAVNVVGLVGGIAAITANGHHTCALTLAGKVRCWGDRGFSQLGDGYYTYRSIPSDVFGLGSSVAGIAAGDYHSCVRTSTGGVKCWGDNFRGQLGDNSTTRRLVPVDVTDLSSGVGAIALGRAHSCALTLQGETKCWGDNSSGQLGDNSTTQREVPTDVWGLGIGTTIAIGTGGVHTCAATSSGGVKCWGYNGTGQLGDNSTTQRLTPIDVSGISDGVTAIAAGEHHTCALTAAGGVKCWGYNGNGQLGDNSTTQRLTPVDVTGLTSGVVAIAVGYSHSCAVTIVGAVKCWGSNSNGQLGAAIPGGQALTPADVPNLSSGVAQIAAHSFNTCVLTTSGSVKCWGSNYAGQLGDNTNEFRLGPVDVANLGGGATAIAVGRAHSCAVTGTSAAKCWGDNTNGAVGDGRGSTQSVPVPVITPAPDVPIITSVTAGDGTANVSFTIPASNGGGPITGYTVTSNPAGGIDSNANSTALTHLITGLTNGVSYTFKVVATNAAGASDPSLASISVTPAGPPSAPTGLVITPGNRRATASFNAPANNGGAAVTSFTVTCTTSGQSPKSATGTHSPITVFGLASGLLYSCSVTARNSAGSSVASTSVSFKPSNKVDFISILNLLLD